MIRVLYVDDEASLLELAQHFLGESKDISLVTSLKANDGLDHVRSGNIDVVVSDYSMPEMDGLAFLKEIRRSGNNIPFILFTGKGREEVVIQALNEGADFYLQKGGDPRPQYIELAHKIRHAAERRSSNKALKDSEARSRRAEEKAKFGHWELHLNDMSMTASPGAMKIYGLTGGKWSHEEVRDVVLPAFREKMDRAIDDLVVRGMPYDVEFQICRKGDGQIVDMHSQAEYDQDRKIIFGVVQDVSDRVKVEKELFKKNEELNASYMQIGLSEEELRQTLEDLIEQQEGLSASELRFRKVFETLPIGLWLADKNGNLLSGNPAGQKIWEANPHVGQGDYGVFKAWRMPSGEMVMPDDWALGHAVNEGKITENELLKIEAFNGKHKYILNWALPLRSDRGAIIGAFVINQDITETTEVLQALKQSEEKYRALLRYSSDPIFNFNPDETYGFVNEAFAKQFGKIPEDIVGKTPHFLFPHDEAERRLQLVRKVFKTKERGEIEVKVSTVNGEVRYYLTIVDPIKDENGSVITVSCISKDITERKRAEEELRESKTRMHTLVHTIPDLIWLKDKDGVYLSCNSIFERFFGAREEDIVGRTDYDFFDRTEADFFREHDHNAMKAGKPTINEEWVTFKDDGHRSLLETIKTPMYDAKGAFIGVLGIGRDITERKVAEEALRKNQKMYRAILDNAGIGLGYWDMDGRLILMNSIATEHLKGTPEDFIGKNIKEIFGEEAGNSYLERMKKTLRSDEPMEYEDQVELPGRTACFISIYNKVQDHDGKDNGVLILSHDITERKMMEEALHLANRKLFLLDGISRHDTLNKLNVLNGYVHLLESTPLSDEQRSSLKKISSSSETISNIARFTKQYQEIGMKSPIWQELSACFERAGSSMNLGDVRLIQSGTKVAVLADPMFENVIMNLIDNAMRHAKGLTTIKVSFEESQTEGKLIIEDDGAGLTQREKEHLFQPGYGKNSGFGLFLCREILEITGMKIEEVSSIGNGARFEISMSRKNYKKN